MGMGMLFAGALTGGARALGEIADDQIKRNDLEKSRQQQIAERREELLYQMQLKTEFAAAEEKREAEAYVSAQDRGKQIGDDRRFGKFKEDMLASGYGEGMDEAQMRKVFDEHYNDKVVTSEAGGDRYYDPESADSRDALQAARSSGAPGATIKALDAEHKGMLQAERQVKADADREARDERRRMERIEADERRFNQQNKLLEKRLEAQAARGGGGSGAPDKPIRFDDAQKAELAPLKRDMDKAADEAAKARPSQRAAAEARAQAARDAYDNKVAEFGGERQKPAAQKSTVKDNQTTNAKAPGTRQTIQSGPHKGKTAEWDGNGWKLVN